MKCISADGERHSRKVTQGKKYENKNKKNFISTEGHGQGTETESWNFQ